MADVDQDPGGARRRRERRAEKLRREYERMGREQNGIFESLAEYTHKVQAEVRALQLARDRFSAEEEIPPVASRGDASTEVRIGSPLILGNLWMSWEMASLGVLACTVLGAIIGALRGRKIAGEGGDSSSQPNIHARSPRPHDD